MNDNSLLNARTHNTVVGILTIACFGTVAANIALSWEFWVPPLILIGLAAALFLHLTQYGSAADRENYYLVFSMLVSFYHGIHPTSFYDIVVISSLMMVNVTLLRRKEFVALMLLEFFVLTILQIIMAVRAGTLVPDALTISRIAMHVVAELCVYKGLSVVINYTRRDSEELETLSREKESARTEMEDFLVNVSHELRTPVNVINGISSIMLKKGPDPDAASIRDAGLRLSRQIEDIQDFSEIERGDVVLEEDKYMILSLVNDVISEYRVRQKQVKPDFIIDLDPDVPAVLKGDAGKLAKILRHLLDNAVKFTRRGCFNLRIRADKRSYGINLILEVSDTGIGMQEEEIGRISSGGYQANRKRNRSTGGIGLGLSVVYGFVRQMNGFVNIESQKGKGTTVRVCVAQEVIDPAPCLRVESDRFLNVIVYIDADKYTVPQVGEYYRMMPVHLAAGLRINFFTVPDLAELHRMIEHGGITHVFAGTEEYHKAPEYFEQLASEDIIVAISGPEGFRLRGDSRVITMPKPLYAYPIVKILNGATDLREVTGVEREHRPDLEGVRALVVDDEPMNLVVAAGLFKEYGMVIDTASGGKEAVEKFSSGSYDVVFMDHMMPEMDGVEAMKRIRETAAGQGRAARVIALTANAVSGARDMFLREGFDGFISKPIHIGEFERTMNRVLPERVSGQKGGRE